MENTIGCTLKLV